MKSNTYDVCVIGGGASGLCAAAAIKMQDMGISVIIAEQLDRVGKKLITTGNGRCNITNRVISPDRYHGKNREFVRYALDRFDNIYTESFFAQLGVVFTYDEQGRAYPYSFQASSVVDALRFYVQNKGVDIKIDTEITDIKKNGGIYEVCFNKGKICAFNIICAGGLYSGGAKLGSNGSLYKILKDKGYKTVETEPSIVQIKTENFLTKSLKGIKVNADVCLLADGKPVRSEYGEVLFCDYGLSGPPVMQLSGYVNRVSGQKQISLDLMPEYSFAGVVDILSYRTVVLRGRTLEEFFTGMLNKRLGQAVLKLCGKKLSDSIDILKNADLKKIASCIKQLKINVLKTAGFESSQVTAGGLDTDSFDPETMMSVNDRGLYAIGEILDVDGDCGGFNLQWAWSSAMCAAESIITELS